jgi:hypothetical protein
MTKRNKKMKGKGIITDIGSIALPALGGLAGATLGTSLGPVGTVLGEAGGSAVGMSLNEWLKSKGLGSGRTLKGNGVASSILQKAKEELVPKIYKGVVKILSKGFEATKEADKMGVANLAQKWLNLFRMRGSGYATAPLMLGSGIRGTPYTYGINGVYQPIPMPGKMKGMGGSEYGMISSEFGSIKV